jgi:voltage-gated potassium channel Kch
MVSSLSRSPHAQVQENSRDPGVSILVCGYNDLVELTLQALEAFGHRAVVVAPDLPPHLEEQWQYLQADPRQPGVLQRAGIERIRVALLLEDERPSQLSSWLC